MQFTATLVAVVAAMATAVSAIPTTAAGPNHCDKPGTGANIMIGGSKFTPYDSIDFNGGDINPANPYTNVADRNACLVHCVDWNKQNKNPENECKAVTWNKVNKYCWIKKQFNGCGITSAAGQSALLADCN